MRSASGDASGNLGSVSGGFQMNWRKAAYLSYASLRGYSFPSILRQYSQEYARGLNGAPATLALGQLLQHCQQSVPYYARRPGAGMRRGGHEHPQQWLQSVPTLTK